MSYSILSSGNQKKRQAINTFGNLARQEQNRNLVNDRLEAGDDAQRNDAIGQVAGMAGKYAIKDYLKRPGVSAEIVEQGATTAEIDSGATAIAEGANVAGGDAVLGGAAPIVEQGAATAAIDAGGVAAAAEAGTVAEGALAATEAAALAEGTAAATTAASAVATGGAAATGGAVASSGGALAALGPVGWAAGAALLAYSLFG